MDNGRNSLMPSLQIKIKNIFKNQKYTSKMVLELEKQGEAGSEKEKKIQS